MKKLSVYYKIPLFFILTANSIINANESRFNRIIWQYNNYNYFLERRNIHIDFLTVTDDDQKYSYPSLNYIAVFNATDINTSLTFTLRKNLETYVKEKRKLLAAAINIDKNDKKFQLDNIEYFLDTTAYLFEIQGRYKYYLSRYLTRNNKQTPAFMQIIADAYGSISHLKKRGYDKDLESIDNDTINELKGDWIIKRKQNATILAQLTGGIGIGKQMYASPVYQIVQLEKRLIKSGVISARFSDKTVAEIAKLLAENTTYTLKKLEESKKFKSRLDSIIINDPSVKKESLRYISPLEIRKILLCNAPVLIAKPKARLFTTSHAVFELNRFDNEYPYDELGYYNDTSYIKPKLRYEHLLGMDFVWGIPFTSFWFLDIKAVRHLISTDKEIDFYDGDEIDRDEVLDVRWDIQSSLWFTNWLLIRLGLKNLPAWVAVPRESPYDTYIHLNIFIEDYLSLTTALSYCNYRSEHFYYLKWHEPLKRTYNGLVFTITALYNF